MGKDEWVDVWHSAIDEEDPQKRMELLERSLGIAKENDHWGNQAASLAAIRMIKDTKAIENVVSRGAGVIKMAQESDKIWWFINPAFCSSAHNFADMVGHSDWHIAWQPMLPYGYWEPYFRIPLTPVLGKNSEDQDEHSKVKVVSSIESLSDRVEVPAGTFENCLRFRNVITQEDGPCPQHVAGTAWLWFSPEVGLVKERYCHADGDETLNELVRYSVKDSPDSPLPLKERNTWEYRGTKKSNPVVATHVFWIQSGRPDVSPGIYNWSIPYYSYATFRKA